MGFHPEEFSARLAANNLPFPSSEVCRTFLYMRREGRREEGRQREWGGRRTEERKGRKGELVGGRGERQVEQGGREVKGIEFDVSFSVRHSSLHS